MSDWRAGLRQRMRLVAGAVAMAVALTAAAPAQDDEIRDDRGLTEYEIACMSCHGADGHGDGEKAGELMRPPADLTKIAKANGGRFPEKRVRDMIDGRAAVAAHGMREMPVWGARYRVSGEPSEPARDVDKRARELISALVGYLKSIQER